MYAVAKKVRHPLLATLATRVRLDNFKKVSEEIDGMVRRKFLFFFRVQFSSTSSYVDGDSLFQMLVFKWK